METTDITRAIFEIVPLRNLGISLSDNILSYIGPALTRVGFQVVEDPVPDDTLVLRIADRKKLESFCRTIMHFNEDQKHAWLKNVDKWINIHDGWAFFRELDFPGYEDQLVWLSTEFFEYLIVTRKRQDLLFALVAETNASGLQEEWMKAQDGWITGMGGYLYIPFLPRFISSFALDSVGAIRLADRLMSDKYAALTMFPTDTAVAGDIVFTEAITDITEAAGVSPLFILWPGLPGRLKDLLKDEALLDRIEIGRVAPFLFFVSEDSPWHHGNHLQIEAISGTWKDLLEVLFSVSLHMNWIRYVESADRFSADEKTAFARAQANKLAEIKHKEEALVRSLRILKDRYPHRRELTDYQARNLYSHVVWHSPEYTAWSIYLKRFSNESNPEDILSVGSLNSIDWVALERNRVAKREDADEIARFAEARPKSALGIIREITEKTMQYLYMSEFGTRPTVKFSEALRELGAAGVFDESVQKGLNYLWIQGSTGLHGRPVSPKLVVSLIPTFVYMMQWFADTKLT